MITLTAKTGTVEGKYIQLEKPNHFVGIILSDGTFLPANEMEILPDDLTKILFISQNFNFIYESTIKD